MAGIGFELKAMFAKKGLISIIKAYGYAGIVCTGPMILGVVFLLGIRGIAYLAGAGEEQMRLINSMVTYTLLFSLVLTNMVSLVTTRFTADQLYMEEKKRILPSFWGSISILLVPGCLLYGLFLSFSGISVTDQFFCLLLMGELVIVWTEINYLTAIKDYQSIITVFFISVVCALFVGFLLVVGLHLQVIHSLMAVVCIAYGLMAVWYDYLLVKYFPEGEGSAFYFLKWFDKYRELAPLGLSLALGLFAHPVIMWTSPIGNRITGLFYEAPLYDISALLAFLSILSTTINFVTSVEVNFYPKYRNYFSLFNDGGSLLDIEQAEREMKTTLIQELTYTFTKQFFVTVIFIIAGTFVLPGLPIGVTEDMLGIYRVLCIAYAFYAIGNCIMLIQLYFSDNKGALLSGISFMLVSCIGSAVVSRMDIVFYGVGFLAGGIVFTAVSLFLLRAYMKKLIKNILCNQPIVLKEYKGGMTRISEYCEQRYWNQYPDLKLDKE